MINAMPTSDLDIQRSANLFVLRHGDDATAKAREMVAEMRRKHDNDGADRWLRIIVAIGTIADPMPGAPRQD
jgi:hypothetical protein